jgi:hypothetical protein
LVQDIKKKNTNKELVFRVLELNFIIFLANLDYNFRVWGYELDLLLL